MKRKLPMQSSGFTIMEMVIYGAILSIFVVILTTMFSSILDTQMGSEANTALVQDGRYIMSRFSYDVNRASNITVPASPGGQSSTLTLTINGTANTYAVSNGSLTLTNTNGTDVLNSAGTTVSGASFLRLGKMGGKNSIKVSFTLTSSITQSSGIQSKAYDSTFSLR